MGSEDFLSSAEQVYTKVISLGLPGADEVNESYEELSTLVTSEAEMRRISIWKSLEKNSFFKFCKNYVAAAIQISKTIKKGRPVMIQSTKSMSGHAGDSTTNVLMALVQLLVDPYFRTFEGFLALIEKEWTMYFTFAFAPPEDPSPNAIFVMFLHCVWMCHQLRSEAFEFDASLLDYIHSELYSARYHDFIFLNRYDRLKVSRFGDLEEESESEEEREVVRKRARSPTESMSATPIPSPVSSLPTTPMDSNPTSPTSTPPTSPHGPGTNRPGSARSHVSARSPRGLVGFSLMRAILRKRKKVC